MSGLRQQRKLFTGWVQIILAILLAIVLGNAFPAPAARQISLEDFCAERNPNAIETYRPAC